MGQESGSRLARWFCFEVSHEVVVKVSTGPQSSKVWKICLQGHLLTVPQVRAGYWQEVSAPPEVDLAEGLPELPYNMADGFPLDKRSEDEQGQNRHLFHDPVLNLSLVENMTRMFSISHWLHRPALVKTGGGVDCMGCE